MRSTYLSLFRLIGVVSQQLALECALGRHAEGLADALLELVSHYYCTTIMHAQFSIHPIIRTNIPLCLYF